MCGIVGLFSDRQESGDRLRAAAEGMARAISHRGPDDSGVWIDPSQGIALAHRRLSIVDISAAGHQPMISASGTWTIVFNGEIYNHQDLRDELVGIGKAPHWVGHSDTETLLAALDVWGLDGALRRCVGMFAFAAWNRREARLVLARDRLGEKPLYYGWLGSSFAFASELKALRAVPGANLQIDRNALALFFRHNHIPSPHSIYEGISKLEPGKYLQIDRSGVRTRATPQPKSYWSLTEVSEAGLRNPFLGSAEEAVDRCEEVLQMAVRGQMLADVPLGAFLSGGIDSSLVVALMQRAQSAPVKTFTLGFDLKDFNEAVHAKAVARHLGTDHTELYVRPEQAQSVVQELPRIYDEPFSDSSQIPTYLVSKLARGHVTVSLSGDGGDELFGGYNRYFLGDRIRRKLLWLPLGVRRRLAKALAGASPVLLDRTARILGSVLPQWRITAATDKAMKLAEILSLEDERRVYRRLVSHWDSPAENLVLNATEPVTQLDQLLEFSIEGQSFAEWMMMVDGSTYLPDDILVKVDRAAMAVSLETRVPLLDHRVVEFAASLPLGYKIRDGKSKWVLRALADRHIPRALLERPKMGFGIPIGHWMRGPMRDWAEDLLSERRLRQGGFLNHSIVRQKWNEHVNGVRNWQYYLWDVLMFQAWADASE